MSCMECSGKASIKGSLCISWHCVSSKTGHDVELTVYSIGFIGTMFEAKTSQEAATETTFSQGTSSQVQVSHSETVTIFENGKGAGFKNTCNFFLSKYVFKN